MEKTVELDFQRATDNKLRYVNPETGVIYLPKTWFGGQTPAKISLTVTAE